MRPAGTTSPLHRMALLFRALFRRTSVFRHQLRAFPQRCLAGMAERCIQGIASRKLIGNWAAKVLGRGAAQFRAPALRRAWIDTKEFAGILIGTACQQVDGELVMTAPRMDARRQCTESNARTGSEYFARQKQR